MSDSNYVTGQEVWYLTENGLLHATVVKPNKKRIKITFQRFCCSPQTQSVPYERVVAKNIPCCIVATYTTKHEVHLRYRLDTIQYPKFHKLNETRNWIYEDCNGNLL